jgi:K+-transporting ATPase KdpC subunit
MNKSNGPTITRGDPKPAPGGVEAGFVTQLIGHIKVSLIATIVLAIIVSGLYPVVVFGLAQALFHHKANGSLIGKDGQSVSRDQDAIGSSLIGQGFSDAKYFHPRPSAAGNGYDATASGGSNLGPTSAKLMFGTTKNAAITILAHDKAHPSSPEFAGRLEGAVTAVTGTSISVSTGAAGITKTYTLASALADPATPVNVHGRTIKVKTVTPGAKVELDFSDKTPPEVTAINVIDSVSEAASNAVDTTANTITLPGDPGASPTVINVAASAAIILNGKSGAKLGDITPDMPVRVLVSVVMDYDGVADRVVHYCEDNNIPYQSTIASSEFKDADGIDDAKLNLAFNAASTPPVITPATPIPADAVTASASGLDPHISPANAKLQAQRVADARKVPVDKVKAMIEQYTDSASLGFLGDPGVNVLRLNLALDSQAPIAAPAAAMPTTGPTTAP